MTEILRLDYTAALIASGDISKWTKAGTNVAATATPTRRLKIIMTAGSGHTATRTLTDLVVGQEYTVHAEFDGNNLGMYFKLTAGGTFSWLEDPAGSTFTATSTTADVVIGYDGTTTGSEYVNLTTFWVETATAPVDPNAPGPVVVTGTTSHLHDTVEIITGAASYNATQDLWTYDWDNPTVEATLPAYVGYTSTALETEPGKTGFYLTEELRVILPAFNFQPPQHRIRWRGEVYLPDGPPMLRRRRGRDLTISAPIKAVSV